MHKKTNKLIAGIMSLIVAAASAVSAVPVQVSAVSVLGESTFEKKAFPWHICQSSPAMQKFDIEDGNFHVRIIVPTGAEMEKWDLQFRHRNLYFKKGHEYKVSFRVKGKRDGMELCSKIGNIKGDEEYFELDGQTNDMHMGPHMGGQWALAAVKLTTEWQTFEGVFKPTKDIEAAEWCFEYAKGTKYQGNAQEGDEIWFDDMVIDCLTCEESDLDICGSSYPSELGVSPRNDVRINQMGYFTEADKKATYATSDKKEAMDFKVVDKDGKAVYKGKSVPAGFDTMADEYCQIIDFSELKTPGTYSIVVDDKDNSSRNMSHEFRIGDDIYDGVLRNALNYYYQNRSGSTIEAKYITSGDKKQLAYNDINKNDIAYVQSLWPRTYYLLGSPTEHIDDDIRLDVTGGWYDTENYSKSVTSGGTAVWLLQNMYERSKNNKTDAKWADDKTMTVPSEYKLSGGRETSCKGTPDILDEARYELEFMFRMIVDPEKDTVWGENYSDFVYDQVRELYYLPVPYTSLDYIGNEEKPRLICPPTYGATLNMIACAAQAARLWKGIDDDFAKECLEHAEKSWEAVMKHQDAIMAQEDNEDDPYANKPWGDLGLINCDVDDEAYWAACELFATTGDKAYYDYLKKYKGIVGIERHWAFGVPNYVPSTETYGKFASFDNDNKNTFGTLSLYLSDKTSEADRAEIKMSLREAADTFLECENDTKNGAMGIPYMPSSYMDSYDIFPITRFRGYDKGSNSIVADNAIIMAYAYDDTGESKYLNGALQAMDYIFGRNALGFSYVTGCGSYHVKNPRNKYWCFEIEKTFPQAPDGVMVGGPSSWEDDDYLRLMGINTKTPVQKSYADSVEAWSVNAPALEWQAGLAWDMAFFEETAANAAAIITTTTTDNKTTATTTTTTTTTATASSTGSTTTATPPASGEPPQYGDVNCDGSIDMSDAVLIMQALANPNKYGLNGSDNKHITKQGTENADVEGGNGLTTNDALTIQKYLLNLIPSLPV